MNWTDNDPHDPRNYPDVSHLSHCCACGKLINRYHDEVLHIDGLDFCADCDDLVALRNDGYIKPVTDRTFKLKCDYGYQQMWESIYDKFGGVVSTL